MRNPAPAWTTRQGTIRLWHGCTEREYNSIQNGIDLTQGRLDADFGQGFYTTTIERQARDWAWARFYSRHNQPNFYGNQPVIVHFDVPRDALARLHSIWFVNGDYDHLDYWSIVQHCRQSTAAALNDHKQPGWYDLAIGPVAAFWEQRVAMSDADQVSFHTGRAAAVLNQVIFAGMPGFGWHPVV